MKNNLHIACRAILIFIAFTSSYSKGFAQNWDQIIKANAADRNDKATGVRSIDDGYGVSVAISGDYAVVGAWEEQEDMEGDNTLKGAGAAYILHRTDGKWKQLKKICPATRKEQTGFGYSVAINGDYVVVGAAFEDSEPTTLFHMHNTGAVYLFKKDHGGENNWGQIKKLIASTLTQGGLFGYSLAISGDYLVVGSPSETEDFNGPEKKSVAGAAYVFKNNVGGTENWGLVKKLTMIERAEFVEYGMSVGISGDNIVVGCPFQNVKLANNVVREDAGSVLVYNKFQGGNDNWGLISSVVSPNLPTSYGFGGCVAISGNYLVIGHNRGYGLSTTIEAAYMFEKNQGGSNKWGVTKTLVTPTHHSGDYFGMSMAISGEYVIVGALGDDTEGQNPLLGAGAAYLFKRDEGGAGNWGQIKKITASIRQDRDIFGAEVAISGQDVLIGAERQDNDESESNPLSQAGAAYFFQRDKGGSNNWGFVKKGVAEDLTPDDNYGYSVAINGNYAVVGSPNEDQDRYERNTLPDAGAAYILFNNNGKWVQVKKLTPEMRGAGDHFGTSVAIDGPYVIVGAPGHNYNAEGNRVLKDAGAAYIFFIDAGESGNWGQVDKLSASNRQANDLFGTSVSMSAGIAVVGAPNTDMSIGDQNYGSVYVFAKDANTHNWNQTKELTAEARFDNAYFGNSVAVSENHIIVGAQNDYHNAAGSFIINSGAAYVFKKDDKYRNNWVLAKKIYASVPTYNDGFGRSVSISGDYAIVGAYAESENSQDTDYKQYSGSAYIFKKDQGGNESWGQIKKLTAADRSKEDLFGASVSINEDYAIVGAYLEDENAALSDTRNGSGSAYLFHKNIGGQDNWGQEKKITAYSRHAGDQFGQAVAISGLSAIAGSPFDQFDTAEQNQLAGAGSVHIFSTTIFTQIDVPIKLSSFTADKVESQARISWEVTSEKGLDYFQVQKSTDSYGWATIGELSASQATENTGVYSMMDLKPDEGQNFYRVKMVHSDGSIAYGKVGNLEFEELAKMEVYPNPAIDRIFIKANTSGPVASVRILNTMGKVVINQTDITSQGIAVNHLPTGIYLVQIIKPGGATQTEKILVSR